MTKHVFHYLPLYAILALGLIGMYVYQYEDSMQKAIVVAISVGYLLWGIVHHKIHDDLTFEIFLEYVFVALIGSALLFSVV